MSNITTRDFLSFDLSHVATMRNKQIFFDRPGIIFATYGYSFGEHLWLLHIKIAPGSEQASLLVGVLNKRFSNTNKLHGAQVNLSSAKTEQTVRILLDSNKKSLIVFSSNEVVVELPKDSSTLIPAI